MLLFSCVYRRHRVPVVTADNDLQTYRPKAPEGGYKGGILYPIK